MPVIRIGTTNVNRWNLQSPGKQGGPDEKEIIDDEIRLLGAQAVDENTSTVSWSTARRCAKLMPLLKSILFFPFL